MKPTKDKVFIKLLDPEEKSAGGIYYADESKEKEQIMAEVVAVCDNWNDLQSEPLNPGDKIIVPYPCGIPVEFTTEENGVKVFHRFKAISHKEVLIIL